MSISLDAMVAKTAEWCKDIGYVIVDSALLLHDARSLPSLCLGLTRHSHD